VRTGRELGRSKLCAFAIEDAGDAAAQLFVKAIGNLQVAQRRVFEARKRLEELGVLVNHARNWPFVWASYGT
jgi:hypothetical protein